MYFVRKCRVGEYSSTHDSGSRRGGCLSCLTSTPATDLVMTYHRGEVDWLEIKKHKTTTRIDKLWSFIPRKCIGSPISHSFLRSTTISSQPLSPHGPGQRSNQPSISGLSTRQQSISLPRISSHEHSLYSQDYSLDSGPSFLLELLLR